MEWTELRSEFEKLQPALKFARIDFQWGVAGTYYNIMGVNTQISSQFRLLSKIAGNKLNELPDNTLNEKFLNIQTPEYKWFEALRYHTTGFELGFYAEQKVEDSNQQAGFIYTGQLRLPSENSATLCLEFSQYPTNKMKSSSSLFGIVERFLKNQKEKYGYFWMLCAFLIMAILGFLSI